MGFTTNRIAVNTDEFSGYSANINGNLNFNGNLYRYGIIYSGSSVGGASGEKIEKKITQISHNFSVGNFIGWSGGTYNKAIANGTYNGEFIGIVSKVFDADTFNVVQAGYVDTLNGLTPNSIYYLSDITLGEITLTKPTTEEHVIKEVLITISATTGWVLPYSGYIISPTGTTISTVNNGLTDNNGIGQLGGILSQDTVISGLNAYNLKFKDGLVKYNDDYSSQITAHSIPDAAWVTANTSTIYTKSSPATCNVGGISIGNVLTGKTIETLLEEMLAPYIEPTFSAFNVNISSPIEVGSSVSGIKTFTWSTTTSSNVKSNSIGICEVSGSMLGSGLANDGTENLDIGTKTNGSPIIWTWQITGSSTCDDYFNRNVSKCSIYPIYYGKLISDNRPAVTNELITTGCTAKPVINSVNTVTVSFYSASNEYTWLAIPSTSPSRICWYVNALDNGLINSSPSDKYPDECIISVTSAENCWSSINYKVYMSGAVGEINDPMQFRR